MARFLGHSVVITNRWQGLLSINCHVDVSLVIIKMLYPFKGITCLNTRLHTEQLYQSCQPSQFLREASWFWGLYYDCTIQRWKLPIFWF